MHDTHDVCSYNKEMYVAIWYHKFQPLYLKVLPTPQVERMVSLDGASFSRRRKEGRSLFIGVWFMLNFFMGGWCCFPGGMAFPASPLNSSTACCQCEEKLLCTFNFLNCVTRIITHHFLLRT